MAVDCAAVGLSWPIALVPVASTGRAIPLWVAAVAVHLVLLASQQLYLARVCHIRAVEVARLARVSGLAGVAMYLGARELGVDISGQRTAVAAVACFACLSVSRSAYRSWLRAGRLQGRFSRPVVIVGTNGEAVALERLLSDHPELGFRVVATACRADHVLATCEESGANSVMLAASSMAPADLNRLTRQLLGAGIHVHLSNGLMGFDHRRLRAQPLAHETIFYLEPPKLSTWQLVLKRAVDIVGASVALLLSLPVLAVSALAIKLQDGGPVLFKHQRIGREGHPFVLFKLRTMVLDAEERLSLVLPGNERTGGPLFKLREDPRVTAVGRVLRATSIDELPQLLNVLRGSMSLVGPRPALPDEVAQFDEDLLARHRMRPGITGLWQVEARDNPSFSTYRRLDLFYIENWSVATDLAILMATVQAVLGRAGRCMRRLRPATIAGELPLDAAAGPFHVVETVPASRAAQ